MRRFAFALLTLVAASAAAQTLPRATDNVLLARLYRKTAAGTDAVGRMAIVLGGTSTTQSIAVPAAGSDPAQTFSVTASRKGGGARVTWQLGAAGATPATGKLDVAEGALNRVSLVQDAAKELYASIEAGRVSSFDVGRLMTYFGGMPWGMSPSPNAWTQPGAPPVAYPVATVAPAPPPVPKTGPRLDVTCPSGDVYELALATGHGSCQIALGPERTVIGGTCSDGDAEVAEADCGAGCLRTAGSGTCRRRP